MASFNVTIKAARKRLGMSQSQLAEALGVTVTTISRWERGERAPHMPGLIVKAVEALKPPADKRFGTRTKKGGK